MKCSRPSYDSEEVAAGGLQIWGWPRLTQQRRGKEEEDRDEGKREGGVREALQV